MPHGAVTGLLGFLFVCLFVCFYFWLCWVFVSVRGLSLVAASGGHSSSRCAGLSPSRPLLLQSTGSRCAGSVVVAHGPSRSAACGIFPDQGSNPCPLHWQADSQPLRHQGSPRTAWFLQGPSERWQRLTRWAELTSQDPTAGCPGAGGEADRGADSGGERLARWPDFKGGARRISG